MVQGLHKILVAILKESPASDRNQESGGTRRGIMETTSVLVVDDERETRESLEVSLGGRVLCIRGGNRRRGNSKAEEGAGGSGSS